MVEPMSWKTKFKALPNWEKAFFIAILLLPLYAGEDVSKVNFFTGFIQSLDYFLYRDG